MTAIDLDRGEFRWRITLGVVDETAGGLVFIAATNDRRFRAFDSDALVAFSLP